jgi:hypothetical protein
MATHTTEPLQRPHRRRVFPAQEERQQRHEQPYPGALEHHHEQRAAQNRGKPPPFCAQERAQPANHEGKFAELFESAQ